MLNLGRRIAADTHSISTSHCCASSAGSEAGNPVTGRAGRRDFPLTPPTGKGLTEANPSPYQASDAVSEQAPSNPLTTSSLAGRTDLAGTA
jgi:hypothetical protein